MSPSRRPVPLPCAPLPPSQLPTRITRAHYPPCPVVRSRCAPPLRPRNSYAMPASSLRAPSENPKSPVAARHLFGCRTSRPAHVDFVDAIDEEAPRKEAIDRVSTESGTPQSWRETGFTMAFTPAKRRLLCRVIHLKNTFQKTGILVRLVRIFPG